MAGIGGYGAWRWIFIIEGIGTSVIAAICYFLIPDWPETAKFLKPEERKILLRRLADDAPEGAMTKYNKKAVKLVFTDIKIYLG
jgi:sugar phosphate permease